MEHGISVEVSPLLLSNYKVQCSTLKKEQQTLKQQFVDMQQKMQKDIEETFGSIINKLQEQPQKSTTSTQTIRETSKGVWENRLIKKSSATITTQTYSIPKYCSTTQTIELLKKEAECQANLDENKDNHITTLRAINKKLTKENDALSKEIDELHLKNHEEFAILTKKHKYDVKKEIEKAKELAVKDYHDNMVKYLTENQMTNQQLLKIILFTDVKVVVECVQVWMIQWSVKYYYLQIQHCNSILGDNSYPETNPEFCKFWKEIAVPVANKSENPIFKTLMRDWINLHKIIKNSK